MRSTDHADAAWADPAWQVDSTTLECCHGIGDHTVECTTPAELATIPTPADAHHVESWRDDFGTGEYDHYFRGTRRSAAGVTLAVTGFQAADGTARRDVGLVVCSCSILHPYGALHPGGWPMSGAQGTTTAHHRNA